MTRESEIESRLREEVEEAGGACINLPALLYRGIPDRLVLLPGAVIVFVELKRARASINKRTGIHQTKWRKFLIALGFTHILLEGMEGLEDFRKTYL